MPKRIIDSDHEWSGGAGGGEHTIRSNDPRMPNTGFVYPDEIEQLIESAEIRALLDAFVMEEMFKALAGTINRILSDIIDADNPKNQAIIIAWATGLRLPGLEEYGDVCMKCGISKTELYRERKRCLNMIRE